MTTNNAINSPAFPSVAGGAGKILISNGTKYIESTPTYPSASGSSGTILRSDGTNNPYTTETYPAAAGWTAYTGTITLVGGAGNTVPTYSFFNSRYVRIGNLVMVSINYFNGAGGTAGAGTGAINIALPVAVGASAAGGVQLAGWVSTSTTVLAGYVLLPAGATTLQLFWQATTTSIAAVIGNNQNVAQRQINLGFFYEI